MTPKIQYSTVYAHEILHSFYIFRRYYLAIFRELTPKCVSNTQQ